MTSDEPVLALREVVVERGGVRILDNLSLDVFKGDQILIQGESGAGKTTLFQLLGLLASPDSGQVIVNGKDVSELSERDQARVRRNDVGLVFQDFQLISDLTARENAALPQNHTGQSPDTKWLEELFTKLDIHDKFGQYPASLSGGEKQRVAIARALANRPVVVIADEPTGQLDPESSMRVIKLLKSIQKLTDVALIVISHDHAFEPNFDNILKLSQGHLKKFDQDTRY